MDPEQRQSLVQQGKDLKTNLAQLEAELEALQDSLQREGQLLPNLAHPSVSACSSGWLSCTGIASKATQVASCPAKHAYFRDQLCHFVSVNFTVQYRYQWEGRRLLLKLLWWDSRRSLTSQSGQSLANTDRLHLPALL